LAQSGAGAAADFRKKTAATPTHNADLMEENHTLLTTNAATTRRRGQ